MMKFDEVFLNRMREILGKDFDSFLKSLNLPSEKAIYVNENKMPVEKFRKIVDFAVEQIPYERCGFYVGNMKLGRHSLHHAGAFYVQEPSAMFTVNAIKFRGNEKVLDMCAAPGGKSIQIANRIPNGVLVSNEFSKSRSEILFSNIERMGLKNVIISNDSTENLANAYEGMFDVVLVDAPCSGEGMFRKGEDMISAWNPGLNIKCQIRQMEILENANKALKEGGTLIYSTCTYSLEENEQVVKSFMEKHDYELININYPYSRGIGSNETVRLYPHENRGEGQFVAVLKKREESVFGGSVLKLKNSSRAKDFVKQNTNLNFDCFEFGNYSYYVPDLNLVRKRVNYVSVGVRLGELVNSRFVPFHFMFSAFGKAFRNKINCGMGDECVLKYLKGETFDVEVQDGYGCLFLEDCPLGGFKISAGKFKNFYPKGLRNVK